MDRNFWLNVQHLPFGTVALRKESVDRNVHGFFNFPICHDVALRKESVDRNLQAAYVEACQEVALRKESVDRNGIGYGTHIKPVGSLSARRAWIEILALDQYLNEQEVSLSARRAWIEINVSRNRFGSNLSRSPQGERG